MSWRPPASTVNFTCVQRCRLLHLTKVSAGEGIHGQGPVRRVSGDLLVTGPYLRATGDVYATMFWGQWYRTQSLQFGPEADSRISDLPPCWWP
jgi:hypothetical protein